MNINKNITGIILAGGKSSRMGTDKGLLKLNDSSFIEKIASTLKPFVNEIIIVSDHKEHDAFGFKRIEDFYKDAGPLSGLLSGLYKSKTQDNIILSCDIPFISEELIEQLVNNSSEEALINQIECEGKTMPLIATYKKQCWLPIHKALENDERRVRVLVKSLNPNTITVDSNYKLMVENINTPEQYKTLKHEFED